VTKTSYLFCNFVYKMLYYQSIVNTIDYVKHLNRTKLIEYFVDRAS
jgi:hypothetical protein